MYKLARDEIDTFDITSKDASGSGYRQKLEEHFKNDLNQLEMIIGEDVSEDDLKYITEQHPNLFYQLLMKLFEFLVYLSNIPVDINDENKTINLYEDFLNKVIEAAKIKNGGEVPQWIKVAQTIFQFGKNIKDRADYGQ